MAMVVPREKRHQLCGRRKMCGADGYGNDNHWRCRSCPPPSGVQTTHCWWCGTDIPDSKDEYIPCNPDGSIPGFTPVGPAATAAAATIGKKPGDPSGLWCRRCKIEPSWRNVSAGNVHDSSYCGARLVGKNGEEGWYPAPAGYTASSTKHVYVKKTYDGVKGRNFYDLFCRICKAHEIKLMGTDAANKWVLVHQKCKP